jgi:hypothetical protein
MGAVNLAPTGIRSPDRPTQSKSLYRLSYPGPHYYYYYYYYYYCYDYFSLQTVFNVNEFADQPYCHIDCLHTPLHLSKAGVSLIIAIKLKGSTNSTQSPMSVTLYKVLFECLLPNASSERCYVAPVCLHLMFAILLLRSPGN